MLAYLRKVIKRGNLVLQFFPQQGAEMSVAAAVRIRDSRVFTSITEFGRRSLRKIAQATGLSKSSVARSLKAIARRDKHPESHFWETEEGRAWLRLLVAAALYEFGLKGNQGTERMSEFFKRIRVDTHVGVSPTALRNMVQQMEEAIISFQQIQEEEQGKEGVERDIVAAGDETWLNDKLMLVLMDLTSGYLVVEEKAEDRSYDTWEAKARARLEALRLRVRQFISDRGKSLIKLATAGFGCCPGADIFHAQYGISRWLGRSLHGKLGRARKQKQEAEEKKAVLEEQGKKAEQIAQQEQLIEQCQKALDEIEAGEQDYSEAQQAVSGVVHAFNVDDNAPQTSEQAEQRLEEQARRFEEIAKAQSVQDIQDAVGKFRRQIKDIASTVDAWWLWTKESLTMFELGTELRHWLLYTLLPVIYWYHQYQKTQHPEMRKLYDAAWRKAQAAYVTHPLTRTVSKKELDRWRSWAEWASGNFHRASSAVEGRNGYLSQSYHNSRGLTDRRLAALTVVHNYDTRRRDGSTPAERLYGQQFPDLFEWLIGHVGALPLPRQFRQRVTRNPLAINAVPA